ncbi:MAG: menaquinone biosynthesis family protein [Vicinamibacterales bacterium]
MRITVAHSPDSDDAFMHYGLSSGRVPSEGIEFDHLLADIETLNNAAFQGKYEVSAVSFHAYAHLTDKYLLLPHGSSMGDHYGPIVVTRATSDGSIEGATVAVPGLLTSAFLTLRLYQPDVRYVVMPFDRILEAVRDGDVDAGLLIHEGQLTYASEGLRKVVDLGEWWAGRTGGLPLPLGGNVIRRDLGPETVGRVSRLLHASIAYSLTHRDEALDYALQFGRGLDRADADRFVGMYVNDLTLEYGERGRVALQRWLDEGFDKGILPKKVSAEFAN